jgi:hypothetical protein
VKELLESAEHTNLADDVAEASADRDSRAANDESISVRNVPAIVVTDGHSDSSHNHRDAASCNVCRLETGWSL